MAIDRQEEERLWKEAHPKVRGYLLELMDNVAFQDGRAWDTRTGEEVTHLVDVGLRTTNKQVRRLKETNELKRHEKEHGGFIFAFFKELTSIQERFPSLTKQDIARLMYIATYINYKDNRLQSDNGKRHYNKKDVQKLVGMSDKRFNEFFKRLEAENIIHEAESGGLYINPILFYRGELRNHKYDLSDLAYTRMFKNTVRELYEQFNGRRLGQLSVIYSVLPYVNFSTNIICHNPAETSDDLIKPLELGELAKLLGYSDAHKLKRALNNIKIDGKPVFGFFENPHDRRTKRIVINPSVVFAGNGEQLKAIKVLFN